MSKERKTGKDNFTSEDDELICKESFLSEEEEEEENNGKKEAPEMTRNVEENKKPIANGNEDEDDNVNNDNIANLKDVNSINLKKETNKREIKLSSDDYEKRPFKKQKLNESDVDEFAPMGGDDTSIKQFNKNKGNDVDDDDDDDDIIEGIVINY